MDGINQSTISIMEGVGWSRAFLGILGLPRRARLALMERECLRIED